uniref:Transmembrane protein n=1 Tax=Clandestinovirus TaxID=2831644 RepID=A0A8F8KQE0_9VIRU|nr:transmembrane protein [Clandestinovirus]
MSNLSTIAISSAIAMPQPVRTGLTVWIFDSHKIFKIENASQLDDGTYTFSIPTKDFDFMLNHRDYIPVQVSEADMFLRRHSSAKIMSDIFLGRQIQLRICEDEQVAIDRFNEQPTVKERNEAKSLIC